MSVAVARRPQDNFASATGSKLHRDAQTYCSSLFAGTASIIVRGSEKLKHDLHQQEKINLTNLPVGVLLKIMSYVDVRSVCRLCQSCTYLNCIASDTLLWRRMLERDIQTWKVIGHLSHPLIYHQTTADLPPKTLYSKCYIHREGVPPPQSFTYPFTSRLRSLVRRLQGHVAKVILFGSGLESLPFVRKLFWEQDSPYTPIGLYPGKDGVGSGVCVQHGSTPVNLVTLYTATKAERLAQANKHGQPKINKLISPYSDKNGPELTGAVQSLCQQADAFLLVVDTANLDSANRDMDISLLNAMLQSSPVDQHTPLLVLAASVSSNGVECGPPPVQIAQWLSLIHIQHPWQVRAVALDTFSGFSDSLNWLLQAAQL